MLGEQKNQRGMVGDVVLDAEHVSGVRLTTTSLEITDPQLGIDAWLRIGRMLGHIHRTMNWWIGDWINKGEALFGELAAQGIEGATSDRYNEAERITGLDQHTLQNLAIIAAGVPRSNRVAELSWSVHREVSKLDVADQKKWLKLAHENAWRTSDLVEAMREAGLRKPARPEQPQWSDPQLGTGKNGRRTAEDDPVVEAARRVYHQGTVRNGEAHVPLEAWSQLEAALEDE